MQTNDDTTMDAERAARAAEARAGFRVIENCQANGHARVDDVVAARAAEARLKWQAKFCWVPTTCPPGMCPLRFLDIPAPLGGVAACEVTEIVAAAEVAAGIPRGHRDIIGALVMAQAEPPTWKEIARRAKVMAKLEQQPA